MIEEEDEIIHSLSFNLWLCFYFYICINATGFMGWATETF